jgi:hypothetical protein
MAIIRSMTLPGTPAAELENRCLERRGGRLGGSLGDLGERQPCTKWSRRQFAHRGKRRSTVLIRCAAIAPYANAGATLAVDRLDVKPQRPRHHRRKALHDSTRLIAARDRRAGENTRTERGPFRTLGAMTLRIVERPLDAIGDDGFGRNGNLTGVRGHRHAAIGCRRDAHTRTRIGVDPRSRSRHVVQQSRAVIDAFLRDLPAANPVCPATGG